MMKLEVTFWDVGQGDCTVIRLPDDRLLIIDVGPPDSPLVDWLAARRDEIYGLVLTHNDEDHAGCLSAVLAQCKGRLKNIFVLMDRSDRELVSKRLISSACNFAREEGINLSRLEATPQNPQRIYGGRHPDPLLVYVVHPGTLESLTNQVSNNPKPNVVSAILCLKIGNAVRMVWPGDAAMSAITRCCGGLTPQLIMGPHHGGPIDRKARAYSKTFDDPKPENIFVSVGSNNRYDHPVPSFIEKHVSRGRRLCCSELTHHCDRQRMADKKHVLNNHLALGLPPPRKPSAVTCRGPMVLTWERDYDSFLFDRFHGEHEQSIKSVHRRQCQCP